MSLKPHKCQVLRGLRRINEGAFIDLERFVARFTAPYDLLQRKK